MSDTSPVTQHPPSIVIAPSLACADFLHLARAVQEMEAAGVEYLHIDVMDGQFVPNFALSPDIMTAVRRVTHLPLDVHLMVDRPERYLSMFIDAGAHILTIHQEATVHLQRALAEIRRLGALAGVALNPATPPETLRYVLDDLDLLLIMTVNPGFYGQRLIPAMLKKIADARRMFNQHGLRTPIAVDGNVSFENAPRMVAAGANFLVGGTSSIFRQGMTITEGVRQLRHIAQAAADAADRRLDRVA